MNTAMCLHFVKILVSFTGQAFSNQNLILVEKANSAKKKLQIRA